MEINSISRVAPPSEGKRARQRGNRSGPLSPIGNGLAGSAILLAVPGPRPVGQLTRRNEPGELKIETIAQRPQFGTATRTTWGGGCFGGGHLSAPLQKLPGNDRQRQGSQRPRNKERNRICYHGGGDRGGFCNELKRHGLSPAFRFKFRTGNGLMYKFHCERKTAKRGLIDNHLPISGWDAAACAPLVNGGTLLANIDGHSFSVAAPRLINGR